MNNKISYQLYPLREVNSSPAPFNYFLHRQAVQRAKSVRLLKWGFWIYFFLLIFEGALRKWVLPGLATSLLIVRDPIALIMVLIGWNRGLFNKNTILIVSTVTTVVSVCVSVLLGHGSLIVAVYGARLMLLHFPLIFIIGKVLSRADIIRFGKVLLTISVPMTILITAQFYSPQSAWVNKGLGGEDVRGFSGALGYFRPPGTFSFTTGVTAFFGLVAPFVFYFVFNINKINKLLLLSSALALLISVPISLARTLFFYVSVTAVFALLTLTRKPKFIINVVYLVIGGVLLLLLLSKTEFFQTAVNAFSERLNGANETEGGLAKGVIGNRYFGNMIRAFENVSNVPYFGYGLGFGTNVGLQILSLSKLPFYVEDEFTRQIAEMGFLLGLLTILCRVVLSLNLFVASYKKLAAGDLLPWLLVSFTLLIVPQGQWAQPTTLGFAVLIGGLALASLQGDKLIA